MDDGQNNLPSDLNARIDFLARRPQLGKGEGEELWEARSGGRRA